MQIKFSLTGYMYNLIVVKIDIWDYLMGTNFETTKYMYITFL